MKVREAIDKYGKTRVCVVKMPSDHTPTWEELNKEEIAKMHITSDRCYIYTNPDDLMEEIYDVSTTPPPEL